MKYKVKPFLLFVGEYFYPSSTAFGDFDDSFDTEQEAEAAGKKAVDHLGVTYWYQVVELDFKRPSCDEE